MKIDEFVRQLTAALQQEVDAAGRLLDILNQEHAALSATDAAAIEQVGELKQEALNTLEERGKQRAAVVSTAGCKGDRQDVEALIERCDPQGRTDLAGFWHQLLERAAECQRLNLVNGAIIQSSFRFSQQALAVLRGQPPTATPEYGPDGITHQSLGSNPLARA